MTTIALRCTEAIGHNDRRVQTKKAAKICQIAFLDSAEDANDSSYAMNPIRFDSAAVSSLRVSPLPDEIITRERLFIATQTLLQNLHCAKWNKNTKSGRKRE
jgi:hypothetical protein